MLNFVTPLPPSPILKNSTIAETENREKILFFVLRLIEPELPHWGGGVPVEV